MSAENIPDSWKLDSGLRSSMDLDIDMAYFATSQDYQGGRVYRLVLTGTDEAGETVEMMLSVGGDWSSSDGGATITHAKKTRINKSTIYGHFINAAIEIDDVVDNTTLREVLFSRGDPTTAAIWNGVKIHLDLVEITFGKNVDPQERLLPTNFLGLSSDHAAIPSAPPVPSLPTPAAPATLAPTAPTAPAATPAPLSPLELVAQAKAQAASAAAASNGGSPLFQEMIDLAKASTTHADFIGAAFARADVLADEELAIQVADENNGIWVLAKS